MVMLILSKEGDMLFPFLVANIVSCRLIASLRMVKNAVPCRLSIDAVDFANQKN